MTVSRSVLLTLGLAAVHQQTPLVAGKFDGIAVCVDAGVVVVVVRRLRK